MKKDNSKPAIIILFFICFFMFAVSPFLGIVAYIMLIIFAINSVKKNKTTIANPTTSKNTLIKNKPSISMNCNGCGAPLQITDTECSYCGTPFSGDNVVVTETVIPPRVTVSYYSFDPIFRLPEEKMLEEFIKKELTKAEINEKLIPLDVVKRKKVFNIIFSILLFIYICLIFFHFPILTYIIGAVILFIFFKLTRNFNMIKYLKKQIKARPSEKISNIVMNMKTNLTIDNSRKIFAISMVAAVILPMLIFIKPIILYEEVDNGYNVRYYAFGITNFTSATIPETHNGKYVVGLRGNTFSNMFFLREVTLPDTIIEIRGEAFKNTNIKEIKLPKNLVYLGGGAFYGCKSLEKVELSNYLTEIKGNTFENCKSLKSIVIPDSVTRIGGHAFYGCSSLSEVTFTSNSKLNEIGSSAFRQCSSLYSIYLPPDVSVNSRAFKESPTQVKELAKLDFENIIDSNKYTYDTFTFLHIGESDEINKYKSTAKLQDAYISLENINKNNDLNEFVLKYKDATSEINFTLTKLQPYKIINENIAVEIQHDYVYDYDNRVSLNIYYN